MKSGLDHAHLALFYSSLPDREGMAKGSLADYFAYYLQVEVGRSAVTVAELKECFRLSDLGVPTWLATHLTANSKGKSATYVKSTPGYRLHAHARERLAKTLGAGLATVQSSAPLKDLYDRLEDGARKAFLREAIDSFSVGANRAAVVMFWLFLLDHLFELVLSQHLQAFNAVLAANTDKRIKISAVSKRDDFSEIPEGKFIEFLRSAGVITADVKRILEQKLGTRNTAAHPSSVTFRQSKANEFFEDLLENVYGKYPLK